jgi:hypothetical protein
MIDDLTIVIKTIGAQSPSTQQQGHEEQQVLQQEGGSQAQSLQEKE